MKEKVFSLVTHVLTHKDLFRHFIDLLELTDVSEKQRGVIRYSKDYFKKTKSVLTVPELQHKFGELVPIAEGLDSDYVREELYHVIRNDALKSFIIRVSEDIESGRVNYEDVYSKLKWLRMRLEAPDLKLYDVKAMTADIVREVVEVQREKVLATGITSLDKVLGGVGKGEITILIAPPGIGKTTFLVNCAYGAMVHGVNVCYVSLELNEKRIAERIVRRAAKLTREEIRAYREKSQKEIDRVFKYVTTSLKVLYRRPDSLSSIGLESVLELMEEKDKPELLIIDYLDKLKIVGDYRRGLGAVTDELRLLAEQNNMAVVTVTQGNRSSLSAPIVTEEHIGESFKKVENADVILSLCTSEREGKEGKARLVILKNREGRGRNLRGTIIPIKYDLQRITME